MTFVILLHEAAVCRTSVADFELLLFFSDDEVRDGDDDGSDPFVLFFLCCGFSILKKQELTRREGRKQHKDV